MFVVEEVFGDFWSFLSQGDPEAEGDNQGK
jgi:hypothetical protein